MDAPIAHCVILSKLSHRLVSIYTILYIEICYIERKYIHVYIVVGAPARVCIYVFKNMRQYIISRTLPNLSYCWIRLPEASIRAVSREKETLLFEPKQSIAFPFFIQFRQGSFTRDTSHDGLHFSCSGI